jgi:hypothetical protein
MAILGLNPTPVPPTEWKVTVFQDAHGGDAMRRNVRIILAVLLALGSAQASATEPSTQGGFCGSRPGLFESQLAELTLEADAVEASPKARFGAKDVGHIAVIEAERKIFNPNRGILNEIQVARKFYKFHDDDYDMMVVYASFPSEASSGFAFSYIVRNKITGLGLGTIDHTNRVGSSGELNSLLGMNDLLEYPDDPNAPVPGFGRISHIEILSHEVGHRWAAYIQSVSGGPLADNGFHWNYNWDTDGSVMEGNEWLPDSLTPGLIFPADFTAGRHFTAYSDVDLYLIGDLPVANVGPRGLLEGTGVPISFPGSEGDVVTATGVVSIAIESIIAMEGLRRDLDELDGDNRHQMAFVLVVPEGTDPATLDESHPDIVKLEQVRVAFEQFFNDQMNMAIIDTLLTAP